MSVHFKWFDLWMGVFVERNDPDYRTILYVCPLPMLVFRIPIGERYELLVEPSDGLGMKDGRLL